MAIYHIYILRNPETNDIFYVGQTRRRIATRYLEHIDLKGSNNNKNEFIAELLKKGLRPKIDIVDMIEMISLPITGKNPVLELENEWIKLYTDMGYQLMNKPYWWKRYPPTPKQELHFIAIGFSRKLD